MSSTETRLPEDLLLNPDEAIERAIDRLEACSGEKSLRAEAQDISIATLAPKHLSPEAHKLEALGWKPKERCEKTIWENPATGFWYSKETALQISNNGGTA